jgi:hypothetical protein
MDQPKRILSEEDQDVQLRWLTSEQILEDL